MVVNGRPLKRMKRRVTADLYDFLTFPSPDSSGSGVFTTPFRSTVGTFLSRHALPPPPSSLLPHLLTWHVLFRVGVSSDGTDSSAVCLDVVEEDVARSRSVYCDQCRVVGWSGHPVCTKRYHFIIKADSSNSIGGYNKSCTRCGEMLHCSEFRCKSCNNVMTTDDVEDWVYQQLEDTTHLLHGVIHSNGYGHLLRVNGREGGSKFLSGCHIMDFWDRVCKALGVRKISVMDVSKKYGLEYRLLHAITKGHPWYGDWGYQFGSGSFALTAEAYKTAVETLSNLPLSIFLPQDRKSCTHLNDIISLYNSLSEDEIVNIRDLFCFLMRLIHDVHKSSSRVGDVCYKKPRLSVPEGERSWTGADLQRVEEAMFRVLRAVSGLTWVNCRALRSAVYKVAPPDLLDHCLKELEGKRPGDGLVVRARHNPSSAALEYRIEHGDASSDLDTTCQVSFKTTLPSEEILMRHLKCLYDFMLHPRTMLIYAPESTRNLAVGAAEKLLDCKQFVKDYTAEKHPSSNTSSSAVCVSCQVELVEESNGPNLPNPPPESLVLPPNATISDLKLEASRAFQDVYISLRRFQAEELVGFSGVDDSTQVKHLSGSLSSSSPSEEETVFRVRVRGRCHGKNVLGKFRMERGLERWTVECVCGAGDDDGERMLACDACGVWQHTRCSGIRESDAVPARFVCPRCRGKVGVEGKCKDEADAGGGSLTAAAFGVR